MDDDELIASLAGGDETALYLPYLAVAACCAAIVLFVTRPQRGLL